MKITLIGNKRAILVQPDCELDHHIAAVLRKKIDSKIRTTNAIHVIFDFSGVNFMDSSGIGVIMGRYNTVKALGGKILLFGLCPQVERIIRMSGIGKIVSIAEDYKQATNQIS